MKITIVFDNYLHNPELKTEWGFSCLIEGFEKNILFDTGSDGEILLENMQKLKLDPKKTDVIIISHDHWDHTGGLKSYLNVNSNVYVYLLPSFSDNLKNFVEKTGANMFENNERNMLFSHVHTTGTLGSAIKEQSLILETKKGLVVITGCAHPGIVNIIENVKEYLKQSIYMVLGGFHLGGHPDSVLKQIIEQFQKLEVEHPGPSHCSGERCRELFANAYKENFMDIGVGKIIEII